MRSPEMKVLALFVCALCAIKAANVRADTSGMCGTNVTWSYHEPSGVLTISGEGPMTDYDMQKRAPWESCWRLITKIVVNEGVTSIGSFTFYCASNLTSLTLPEGLLAIGKYAFYGCESLVSVKIPASLTDFGPYSFSNCNKLTSINVESASENFKSVDGFVMDKNLTKVVQYPGGKVGTCRLPNSTVLIGNGAFEGCIYLESVVIPDGMKTIADGAFSGCLRLTSINIPSSVRSLGAVHFMIAKV